MTQSAMRMNMAGSRPNQQDAQKRSDQQSSQKRGIGGCVIAALILLAGFWPTVLLVLFAAVGVAIGRYRDGDQKTRAAMRNLLNRVRQ